MIAHLCRLAWNRRRTNLLLVGELLLVFLVLTPLNRWLGIVRHGKVEAAGIRVRGCVVRPFVR